MKVNKTINQPIKKIFEVLYNSLIEDIKLSNSSVNKEKVKSGFTYKKNLSPQVGKEVEVNVNILELENPTKYKVSFDSSKGVNYLSYYLEKIDENTTKVELEEKYVASDTINNWNYIFVSFILSRKLKKRLKNQLSQIETILNKE